MEERQFLYKHAGTEYSCSFEEGDTFEGLKRKIQEQTSVQTKRQKVLGVKTLTGKLPQDDDLLAQCKLKTGQRYMVMGQPEELIDAYDNMPPDDPDVVDDLSESFLESQGPKDLVSKIDLDELISKRGGRARTRQLNPPRPGKKCLVLDIDYTFFDMSSTADRPSQLLRPHLHELLESVYPYYDIVIWSATSMRWIEIKLRELGISNNPAYKISTLMDGSCMVPVTGPKGASFNCKPLKMLWNRHPDFYTPANTIMADDLKRNFIFNLKNAYIIPPYKKCHLNFATDTELLWFKYYLMLIKDEKDFQQRPHKIQTVKNFVQNRILPSELRRCTHPAESGQF